MNIYMPSIHGGTGVQAQDDPILAFVDAWWNVLGARARLMREDDRLVLCAMQHASYLSHRTPEQEQSSMHVGMGGSLSNRRVVWAGYKLPSWWSLDKNYVESCARNPNGPKATLDGLVASARHHDHMCGVGWYEGHTVYGVGHSVNDWVILICPVEVA